MRIKLFLIAAILAVVLCFTSFKTSSACSFPPDPDPDHGHGHEHEHGIRVERTLTDGVWTITFYDSDGGVIRVITIGSH
jgi:hypothetical protein